MTNRKLEEVTLHIIDKVKNEKFDEINELFSDKHPYDMAFIFQNIPERHRASMLHHLEEPTLASLLLKLNPPHQLEVLSKIGPEKSNKVLALLDIKVLSRLLRKFPVTDLHGFLEGMDPNKADYIKKTMDFPSDTAGSIMTNRFISIQEDVTVDMAMETIKELAVYAESFNHLYLVDHQGKLTGSVPFRDLILAENDEKLSNIKLEKIVSVTIYTKQTEIMRMLQRYDFTALPVTDQDGTLLGMITFDDMIEIIIHETSEDFGKFSTANKEIDFNTKPHVAALQRLPWLVSLLFIGLISGSIIARFEGTLEKVVALTFFMPLIAGMTGNTGTQSLAVVVRGLAENEINFKTSIKLIFRELWVGVFIGLSSGFLIAIIALIWQGNFYLGIVVGASLLMTLILGTLAGTIVPLILYKCNLDPAVASGPLITTVNDIFSLITYFTIATFFLSKHLI